MDLIDLHIACQEKTAKVGNLYYTFKFTIENDPGWKKIEALNETK